MTVSAKEFMSLDPEHRIFTLAGLDADDARTLHRELLAAGQNATAAWVHAAERVRLLDPNAFHRHPDHAAEAEALRARHASWLDPTVKVVAAAAPPKVPSLADRFIALSPDDRVTHLAGLTEDNSRELHRELVGAGQSYAWSMAAHALSKKGK